MTRLFQFKPKSVVDPDPVGHVVEIEWEDIVTESSWMSTLDVLENKTLLIHTFGICLYWGDDGIIVAGSQSEDGGFGEVTIFPPSVIKDWWILQ